MSHKYEVERYDLKDKIVTLKQQLKDLAEQKRSADQFIAMVRKFSEIEKSRRKPARYIYEDTLKKLES